MHKPIGWRGNTHGHSLAAKGIRMYPARRRVSLTAPVFYAQRRSDIPMSDIMHMARDGKTFPEMMQELGKDYDQNDVRTAGIRAMGSYYADSDHVLERMDKEGVDRLLTEARRDAKYREEMTRVLDNRQKRSFLHPDKANALERGLKTLPAHKM